MIAYKPILHINVCLLRLRRIIAENDPVRISAEALKLVDEIMENTNRLFKTLAGECTGRELIELLDSARQIENGARDVEKLTRNIKSQE